MNARAIAALCRRLDRIVLLFAIVSLGSVPLSVRAQRVLGLDVSAWQGNISQTTWNNIRNVENRQFVFIRASRGGTTGYYNQSDPNNNSGKNTLSQRYDDPYFVQNINRATAAGIFAGSYHYSRPDIIASTLNSNGIPNSGTDEANHFLQMAGAWMRPGYLLPVHDLEAGDGIRSDNDMAQFSIDFSDRIYEVMGIRPAIYINGNYAHFVVGGASSSLRNQVVASYPTLWSARWPNQANPNAIDVQNAHPKDSYTNIYGPWDDSGTTHPWAFWQYASTGRLQSFNNGGSNLDFNVTQGDIEFLKDRLVPAVWMNDNSGDWSTLANWNSGQSPIAPVTGPGQVRPVGTQTLPMPRLPGAAGTGVTSGQHDTVILDRPDADITVTLSSGSHNIRKLFAREALHITGGSLWVNYDPTYPANPSFRNALRSGPISAQFSAPVSISGDAEFSVHTLQIDTGQTFTLGGGMLAFDTIQLMPHASSPAKIAIEGEAQLGSLDDATAVIRSGPGAGASGFIDLVGDLRAFEVEDSAAGIDVAIDVPVLNGGLKKTGPGTLALRGDASYDGITFIDAGTLSLTKPLLADAADLHLASGATLDLNFSGLPDVVDSLFVDGIVQPAGTWGAEGSGADFISPWITGTGMLQVTTYHPPVLGDYDGDGAISADDYAVWRGSFGNNVMSGTGADGNGDGLVDAADYAVWRSQMTESTVGFSIGGGAVPEPGTACLALLAAMFIAGLRRSCCGILLANEDF